jgi:hypothetical protein
MAAAGTTIILLAAFAYCGVIIAADTPITNANMTSNITMDVILFVFSHQL